MFWERQSPFKAILNKVQLSLNPPLRRTRKGGTLYEKENIMYGVGIIYDFIKFSLYMCF